MCICARARARFETALKLDGASFNEFTGELAIEPSLCYLSMLNWTRRVIGAIISPSAYHQ